MTLALEHHCLELRYTALRRTSRSRERRLLGSLAQNGQLVPVIVVPAAEAHRYVLIDGYKRVRALDRLHVDVVQAMVWELAEADALICERLLRRPEGDGPLEQGWLLLELKQRFGLSQVELAHRFDVSESWVSRRLALVHELPEVIQEEVRAGRIVSHAAQKYLVPLARANRAHAERLSHAINGLSLSSRQVGALYIAYQQADSEGKELIVERPELVVRARQELCDRSDAGHPDPGEQLMRDVRILPAVARRLGHQLTSEVLTRLSNDQRQQLDLSVSQTSVEVMALQSTLAKEGCHAGPGHPDERPHATPERLG
jgi:ParB/RepB/Spo0J family partition protein